MPSTGAIMDCGDLEDAKQNSRRLTDAGMCVAQQFFLATVSLRLLRLPILTMENDYAH
jgi:hypothetical protein